MFFDTKKNDHGLKYDPFKSCVVPRPIGWISTISIDGTANLDIIKIKPLGRLGYYDYTCVDSVFEMVIPGPNEDLRSGMEGRQEKSDG